MPFYLVSIPKSKDLICKQGLIFITEETWKPDVVAAWGVK